MAAQLQVRALSFGSQHGVFNLASGASSSPGAVPSQRATASIRSRDRPSSWSASFTTTKLRVTSDRQQSVERIRLLSSTKSVRQDAQRDTRGTPYAVEAVHEQRAARKLPGELDRLTNLLRRGDPNAKAVSIDVFKLKDEVRLPWVLGKSKAHVRAAVGLLDGDHPVEPPLVPHGLCKASFGHAAFDRQHKWS